MITTEVINAARKFVLGEVEKYGVPSLAQIELSNEKGQWLAKKLKADLKIVLLGTLLMDNQLGLAYKEGRLKDHIEMSAKKTEELLTLYQEVTSEDRKNVINCVKQHHGVKKFYSKESEIVCNADCYKFASIEGFLIGLRYTRDMKLNELMKLLSIKADEKWSALSLDMCKRELEPQHRLIKQFIKAYRR